MELLREPCHYTRHSTSQLCARYKGRVLAKVVLDSVSPDGVRLTTLEVVFPRIVLAEFNTHRVLSRNSASSRAIPVEKMLQRAAEDTYIPETWGRNGRGMQAKEALVGSDAVRAEREWLYARDDALEHARKLLEIGVHKQETNRILEPWLWHTCIVSATEWSNFRHLRAHADAHPAIQRTAKAIIAVLDEHEPEELPWGDWHLPIVSEEDWKWAQDKGDPQYLLAKLSSARSARVSYLTHDGIRDLDADFGLHDRLLSAGHMSPFEHAAQCERNEARDMLPKGLPFEAEFLGNFRRPWKQYRKLLPYEWDVYTDPGRPWEPAP